MASNIIEKIKEILTEEDLKQFQTVVAGMIDEKANERVREILELKDGSTDNDYSNMAESVIESKLSKRLLTEKNKIEQKYASKFQALEEKVKDKLDVYFKVVIDENISGENMRNIAINETLLPIVNGVRKIFANHNIKLNSSVSSEIQKFENAISDNKKLLSKGIEEQMSLEEKLEQSAVYLLLAENCSGMTVSDKTKVFEMYRSKPFEEVDAGIKGFVKMIKECNSIKSKSKSQRKQTRSKKSVNEGAVVDDTRKAPHHPEDAQVIQEETSMASLANYFMYD